MSTTDAEIEVEAAGCVVLRGDDGDREVLVVHRPTYDDWSLPKGKLDAGEDHATAAVRETAEETRVDVTLGRELPEVRYRDGEGRAKRVRYWLAEPVEGRPRQREPDDEIDDARWMTVGRALELLTYQHDRDLVRTATS